MPPPSSTVQQLLAQEGPQQALPATQPAAPEGMTWQDIAGLLGMAQAQEEAVRQEALQGRLADEDGPAWRRPGDRNVLRRFVLDPIFGGDPTARPGTPQAPTLGERMTSQAPSQRLVLSDMPVGGGDVVDVEGMTRGPSGELAPRSGGPGNVTLQGQDAQGNWVFSVDGQAVTVPGAITDGEGLLAYTEPSVLAFGQNPVLGPDSFPRETQRAMLAELGRFSALQGQPRPQGPNLPPSTVTTEFGQRTTAPIRPETAEALAAAQAGVARATQTANMANLTAQAGETTALNALGARQEEMAREQQQLALQQQARLQARMADLDRTLEDVRAMRVDPNQFFGGAGGRIVAALSVALGQLGSALSGGPNTALEIINRGIERSMQAQMANMDHARASANMQGNALSQFRQLLGDEAAAQQATRAALLQAYATQLDGMMSGLRGPQLAAAQQLQVMLNAQAQAEQQAARDQARWVLETRIRTVRPATQSNMAQAGQQASQLVQQQVQQDQAVQAATQPPASMDISQEEVARAEAEMAVEEAMGLTDDERGLVTNDPTVEELRVREASAPARRALSRDPQHAEARAQVRTAQRRARQVGRAHIRRVTQLASPEDLRETYNSHLEQYGNVRQPGPGLIVDPSVPGQTEAWLQTVNDPTRLARADEAIATLRTLDRFGRRMLEIRRELQDEATDVNEQAVLVRTMANMVRDEYRVAITGAAAPEQEMARFDAMVPDPTDITAASLVEAWDGIGNALRAFYLARMQALRDELQNYGVSTDSMAGRTNQRLLGDNIRVYEQVVRNNWR